MAQRVPVRLLSAQVQAAVDVRSNRRMEGYLPIVQDRNVHVQREGALARSGHHEDSMRGSSVPRARSVLAADHRQSQISLRSRCKKCYGPRAKGGHAPGRNHGSVWPVPPSYEKIQGHLAGCT